MRRQKFLVFFLIALLFPSCNKSHQEGMVKSLQLQMSDELIDLYDTGVPYYDYGEIELLTGDILRFANEDHYLYVLEHLQEQYDCWSDLFFQTYGCEDDDEMDELIGELLFDDCVPLQLFEEEYNFWGKNLRSKMKIAESEWLLTEEECDSPVDEIINSIIEQTLFSKYHEICIGDTIYQLRPNGCEVIIPISELSQISTIRNAVTMEDLEILLLENPNLSIKVDSDYCYKEYHYRENSQNHNTGYSESFKWTYKFTKVYFIHRYKTTVTMTNYKVVAGEKKRDFATCALGLQTKLYSTQNNAPCQSAGYSICSLNTPNRHYHRSRTEYTPRVLMIDDTTFTWGIGQLTFHPQIEIQQYQMDPSDSYIKCRHKGWTFQHYVNTNN